MEKKEKLFVGCVSTGDVCDLYALKTKLLEVVKITHVDVESLSFL